MPPIGSRRRFLRRIAAAGMGLAGAGLAGPSRAPAARAGEEAAAVKSAPDVILYRGNYPGWPWIARAEKDRLVCVFRDDGEHGFSPTGRVLLVESRDEGKTWSPARVVADEPGVDDRNAAITRLPDGRLMVCYNTYTAELVSRPMVVVSSDGGATWGKPAMIADLDARTRGAALSLASGDVLIPFYRAPGSGSLAAVSSDGGQRWTVAAVPDVPGFVGDEWVAEEVERGRLVGIIRNNGSPDGWFWKTESRDGGRTWSAPAKTNVRDARSTSPAHFAMHGKAPVLCYADRRMVSVSMVTTRDPEFLAWDLDRRLPCYQYRPDGQPIADGSYPASVAVGDRRRLIVDYEIRDDGRWIAGYFVDLPADWR